MKTTLVKKPNFIIIGAPRSGTTWIDKNIRMHPEIFLPKIKELHFFDRDYDNGLDFYFDYFKSVSNEKAIGEATPSYLHKTDVPLKIHRDLGNIKLIVSLRNPVERLYSRYWNARGKFTENKELSFEEKIDSKKEFIEEGYYAKYLEKYLEFFPKENILILLFDELQSDPKSFLRKIYTFLEVDPNFIAPLVTGKINAAASKPLLGKNIGLHYASRIFRKLHLYSLSQKTEKINRAELPEMNPETRKWLISEVYFDSNKALEDILETNLDHWNQ